MTLKLYTYGPKAHFGGVKNIGYYNLGEHFLSQNQNFIMQMGYCDQKLFNEFFRYM